MSKYGAVRTEVDGITFASKREAHRYQELCLLEKAGEIRGLELQPVFDLYVTVSTVGERLKAAARRLQGQKPEWRGVKIGRYVADFRYWHKTLSASENDHFVRVVEDSKGFRTPLYKWKKRHVEAQYGIEILET